MPGLPTERLLVRAALIVARTDYDMMYRMDVCAAVCRVDYVYEL